MESISDCSTLPTKNKEMESFLFMCTIILGHRKSCIWLQMDGDIRLDRILVLFAKEML